MVPNSQQDAAKVDQGDKAGDAATQAELKTEEGSMIDNSSGHEPSTEPQTKMAQATDIYRRMTRKKGTTRKEIIEVFIEKVGLSKAGASTYYQMIKKTRRSS